MVKRYVWLIAFGGGLLVTRLPATGQDTMNDTSVWLPVLEYVTRTLAPYIARAATDTTAKPWKMTFPASDAPWPSFEAHLRSALRGRLLTPADSLYHELEIGALQVSGDTVRVRVTEGVTRICPQPNRLGGYSNTHPVYLYRVTMGNWTPWSSARSDHVRHADRFSC